MIHRFRGKKIFHFCTPKSASTYLKDFIALNLENKYSLKSLVPLHKDRAQIPSLFMHRINFFKNIYYQRLHYTNTSYLKNYFLSKNDIVILQTRDIYDTIISLKDHLSRDNKSKVNPWFYNNDWQDLSHEMKLDKIISFYLPWHVDFLNSWHNFTYCKVIRVDYSNIENFTDEFAFEFLNSLNIFSSNILTPQKKSVGQFNIGKSGRGKEQLTQEQIFKIENFIEKNLINTL